MISTEIYFDLQKFKKGEFYRLKEELKTNQDVSYELIKWIDRGGNASVFKAEDRVTGDNVAIKFLINRNRTNKRRFNQEIKLLKSLHGDYFTKFLGEGKAKTKYSKTKREQIIPFVVMELADCNLEDKIKKLQINKEIVEYEEYAGQFRGLARALKVLHKESIIHRDIKPENILVVGSKLVLSDFGICTRVQKGYTYITPEGVNVGPKYWLSPEAHNRRLGCGDNITMASDVFQLATIFWYVVNGRHPCGIVSKKDWKGPEKLFDCIHRSLYHDYRLRPKNGIEFLKAIEGALST